MDQKQIEQLQKIAKIFSADKFITSEDVQAVLKGIIEILLKNKKEIEEVTPSIKLAGESIQKDLLETGKSVIEKIDSKANEADKIISGKIDEANSFDFKTLFEEAKKLLEKIKKIKTTPGKPGSDADEEKILQKLKDYVDSQEEAEIEEDAEIAPEEIANKLETLKGDERLDASAIKNLVEFIKENTKSIKSSGSGLRTVFHDSTLSGTGTSANPLSVADSGAAATWNEEYPASGVVDGSNKVFVFTHTPAFISLEGQTLSVLNGDYTVSSKTITLTNAPIANAPVNKYLS